MEVQYRGSTLSVHLTGKYALNWIEFQKSLFEQSIYILIIQSKRDIKKSVETFEKDLNSHISGN